MKLNEIINRRLINQLIGRTEFKKPGEIVSWMGAMQAQEFPMAKWAIGLRLPGSSEKDVVNAFNNGQILRTHLLRPTWHFVSPADIRWMLALTAPRVHAVNAYWYRKFELDAKTLTRSSNVLAKMLEGGKSEIRSVLQSTLASKGITGDGLRLSYLLMHAELEGLICSGPRQGKQFTYALLDERVPSAKVLTRSDGLTALSSRYFTSRGPATAKDYVSWSGLTMKEAKEGIASLDSGFIHEKSDGQEYVFKDSRLETGTKLQKTFLLPDYDEYGMSYKDRSAILNLKVLSSEKQEKNTAYQHMVVIDGTIGATWKRTIKKNGVEIETSGFTHLTKAKQQAVNSAVKKYTKFFGKYMDE